MVQFKKDNVTNFVQSQYWWIVDYGFNGIRHILTQSFVLVVYGVNQELYCFGIKMQAIVFYCPYRSKTNYVQIKSLNIKKTTRAKLSPYVNFLETIIYLSIAVVLLILLLYQYSLIVAICNNFITVATHGII